MYRLRALVLALLAGAGLCDDAWLRENAKKNSVVQLPSGLQYTIIESAPWDETRKPTNHQKCKCRYTGTLIDGTVFDSSQDGEDMGSAIFAPADVIAGWTEALQLMSPGDRWKLYIPSKLAYGSRGNVNIGIPGDATIIFDLEMLEILEESMLDKLLDQYQLFIIAGTAMVALYFYFTGGVVSGKTAHACHILMSDKNLCAKLKKDLDTLAAAGLNQQGLLIKFGELAKEHSTCPSSKSGGSLGVIAPGEMVPAFDEVCWSAPIGVVQGPVQTEFGFHLILVTARMSAEEHEAEQKRESSKSK